MHTARGFRENVTEEIYIVVNATKAFWLSATVVGPRPLRNFGRVVLEFNPIFMDRYVFDTVTQGTPRGMTKDEGIITPHQPTDRPTTVYTYVRF